MTKAKPKSKLPSDWKSMACVLVFIVAAACAAVYVAGMIDEAEQAETVETITETLTGE